MKIKVAAFTDRGRELAASIFRDWSEDIIEYRTAEVSLEDWSRSGFEEKAALVFIGAMGIAVRAIAPCVKDKLEDSPVIVMDEFGMNVIPVLSGHMGGAIELSKRISEQIGANTIITTATDLNQAFAIDVFAREHNLRIVNKMDIMRVSKKSLQGQTIRIATNRKYDPIPQVEFVDENEPADVRIYNRLEDVSTTPGQMALVEKNYVLGIGCKKDKTEEEIKMAIASFLGDITLEDIYSIASIDVKKDEAGIINFANRNRIPFVTYSAEELMALQGEFSRSEFVEKTVGVDCVCERASMKAAGEGAKMIKKKTSFDGITLALAKRK